MKKANIKISTSILAADFVNMKAVIFSLEKAGTDLFHLDIMDGHFVPNISYGPKMVEDINKITDLPLDVHLMITDPIRFIDAFAKVGSDIITVHYEATDDLKRDLTKIRSLGIKAGVSVKPSTEVTVLKEFLPLIDLILIMGVEPGFGGQKFMPIALEKIREARRMAEEAGLDIIIEVDGGVTGSNAAEVIEAGATMLVSGSYLTGSADPSAAMASLKQKK